MTLATQQFSDFDQRGVLRLPGLLAAERVRRARDYVLSRLARAGLWRDGDWRLDDRPRPQWPDSGVKSSKVIGNRHPDVEALIDEPALLEIVGGLLEGQPFDREIYKRPQVMVTLSNIDAWTVPADWHVDGPRLASGRPPGVQLFAFLDTVEPGGGGTLVIAGSHRLLNEGRIVATGDVPRRLRQEDFFRPLYADADDAADRARLVNHEGAVGDVALEVVELTGAPGDAYLIDLRVLHTAAPNASSRPRMMATHRFVRADVMPELARAFGWT